MDSKEISEALNKIIDRLNRIEKTVFVPSPRATSVRRGSRPRRDGLTVEVLNLRESGFFKQPKTAKETHAKLQARYPCELNRVAVALFRLQRRKQLRKASKVVDGKKQVAYVW